MNLFDSKIGIIGLGYVGSAIRSTYVNGLSPVVQLDPAKGFNTSFTEFLTTDGVFVCVPTPSGSDGSCDTSILEDVLESLAQVDYKGVIISKCTAPPDTYEYLNKQYPNLVHVPEFLTAANAEQEYASATYTMIGGSVAAYVREAERIIRLGQGDLESCFYCTIKEAALTKYAINSFLATKVVFMNELKQLADSVDINYDHVASLISNDTRIGTSHMMVPGPDGYYGFGGMCFSKDTAALLKFAEQNNIPLNILDSAVKKNTLLRLTEPK